MKITFRLRTLLFTCLLTAVNLWLSAQDVAWFNRVNLNHAEAFEQMVFVPSDSNPFVVVQLEHIANTGGGGGGNPETTHFMFAYNADGNFLWSYSIPNAPIALLSKEADRYWVVTYGPVQLPTLNGSIPGAPGSNVRHLYFAEFDVEGNVTNSFVWGIPNETEMFINDVRFDTNGDFIFTGRLNPEALVPVNFTFADINLTLDPMTWTHYIARASTNGSQLGMNTFTGKRFGSKRGVVTHLAQNANDGSILLAGRLNDTLYFDSAILVSVNDVHQELCFIQFTEDLEYIDSRSVMASTFGSITRDLVFNEQNNLFYITGTLGDQLYLLDADNPVQGNIGTVQNTFIASVSGMDITGGVYFIPADLVNFQRVVSIFNILFDDENRLLIVANVHENGFWIGNVPVPISPPFEIPDYKIVQFTMNSLTFELGDLVLSTGVGQTTYRQAAYDLANEALFVAGTFNGDFLYGDNVDIASINGVNDAYLFRQNLGVSVPTSIAENESSPAPLVFPNPAGSHVQIISQSGSISAVRFFDMAGRLCLSKNTLTEFVDVSGLIPGVYLMEILTDRQVFQRKLVKQ